MEAGLNGPLAGPVGDAREAPLLVVGEAAPLALGIGHKDEVPGGIVGAPGDTPSGVGHRDEAVVVTEAIAGDAVPWGDVGNAVARPVIFIAGGVGKRAGRDLAPGVVLGPPGGIAPGGRVVQDRALPGFVP